MILKGEKVVLRPVKMDDAPRFVKWFNDPEVNKFLNVRGMKLKDEKKWIKNRLTAKNHKDIFFSIETKEGELIGNTVLRFGVKQDRHADFGVMIGEKDFQNKGYGTDALKALINFGFKKLKLHKIELDVKEYNKRAIKVYQRLGFKKEGIKREHCFYNGKFYNSYFMSILDREWKRRNKK